ncbi:MAG: ATP-binding protein [Alphaproteobacteria bacterium]|nr:ATP-binding protein [Alphaproteobacteria bacterium]
MRRRWSVGVRGHMTVIMVAVVIVVFAGGAVFYLHDRAENVKRFTALVISDRIVSIAEAIEQMPPQRQAFLARKLSNRLVRVRIMPDKPKPRTAESSDVAEFRELILPHLEPLIGRQVIVGAFRPSLRPRGQEGPEPRRFFPRKPKGVSIAVGLSGGRWLVFDAPLRFAHLRWERRFVFVIVAAAAIVLIFAMWATHRVTRPLVQLAEAADRLGVDVRAPPLPEHGSKELRLTTRAFNRMQDRLRRLVDDRTLMLAAISHDLRTVLTRLKLRAEFIGDDQQRDKAVADIDEMQSMLDATLSFARDDTAEEARTDVDLGSLLQSLCDDMADAGFIATYEGTPRLACRCQPVAIRRVFANLIDNALKYGGEATVSAERQGDDIRVEIGDRGPGIPETQREQVFTPFFRLEESRSRETGGTGLGLAVARSIVRRHGGDIEMRDRTGGGNLALVTLPAAESGSDAPVRC